nr:hypothetical protein [Micromonospora sp. DSM 115978]
MTGHQDRPYQDPDDGAVRASFAELARAEITGGSQPDIAGLDEKTLQPLLLHSLAELREVWLPLLEAAAVRSVAEVGSESGMTTTLL